jgi:pimeloyl-ACP methyl ester carboxylesterase
LSPDEDQTVPSYVRIDQVISDGHRVQVALKGEFTGPWMVAGYSYGGSLALWYADAYPQDVRVVLASSAAVDFPFTSDSWDRYLRKYYGDKGYGRLAEHVRNLHPAALFDTPWLARRFVAGLAATIPQRQSFDRYKPLLSFFSRLPTSWFVRSTKWVEGIVNGGGGQEQLRWMARKTVTRTDALSGDLSLRVWRYQQCAETGLFHVSSEKDGIFPESEKEIRDECRALFGIEPAKPLAGRKSPREILDRLSIPVIYVEGGKDPSAGVLHDPGHRLHKGRYFFVPDGRHCPDRADADVGRKVLAEMLRFARLQEQTDTVVVR